MKRLENYTRLHSAPDASIKMACILLYCRILSELGRAGIFGFLINMPVSLFYIQGLNTTAVHAHTALFGVYGFFLSLGFVFLIARYIRPEVEFNDKLMKFGFWALNWGLALMVLISLLPIGLIQSWASVTQGLWARSQRRLYATTIVTKFALASHGWRYHHDIGALAFFWQIVKVTFTKETVITKQYSKYVNIILNIIYRHIS